MTTTTQQTSKKWKGIQGLGCLTSLTALTILMISVAMTDQSNSKSQAMTGASAILWLMGGLAVYTVGRVGAWWCHA